MREVTEKGGSGGSRGGNIKSGDNSEDEVLPMVGVIVSRRDDLRGMLEFLSLNQPSQVQVRAKYEEDRNLGFQKLGNFK